MMLMHYVHTIIIPVELYKGLEKALNLPTSRKRTTMKRSVARPSN